MADHKPLRLVAPDRRANAARRRALSRRTFVGVSLTAAGTAWAATTAGVARANNWTNRDPFRLGVASGDPTPTGVVLWTRLAVDPLVEDGLGGMPSKDVSVSWQLASDEGFANVIRAGAETARPTEAHSVHVEVEGLRPGTEYFYRFRVNQHLSDTGRTRTLPAPGTRTTPLHAIALSCSHYEAGWFTAYHHAAAEQPDLVFALGDYIYEGRGVDGRPRKHPGSTCLTLGDYRARYALYKNEAETQEIHRAAPFLVTWDDHEVADNWAGIYPKDQVPSDEFQARRTAAAQAYWENMPLRRRSRPSGTDIQLYRRFTWGDVADLDVLDTRQYRDQIACADGTTWWFDDCAEQADPSRSMLGDQQEKWLLDGFANTSAAWQIMAQGVFFSQRDIAQGPVRTLGSQGWDGYQASRNGLRDGWVARGVENAVVLTGDVHKPFANEIKSNFDDPDSATVGVEFVTTAVTSTGDGTDDPDTSVMIENPHIKYRADRRGYLSLRVDQQQLRADFAAVAYVSSPGAPMRIDKSFVVPAGDPGLNEVATG